MGGRTQVKMKVVMRSKGVKQGAVKYTWVSERKFCSVWRKSTKESQAKTSRKHQSVNSFVLSSTVTIGP